MKKRLLCLLAVTALLLSLFSACSLAVLNKKAAAGQVQPTADEKAAITSQSAEEIALTHAGLTREEVTRLHTEKDYDDGISYYEVQFRKDRLEYEYDIHAETGKVLSFDKDRD